MQPELSLATESDVVRHRYLQAARIFLAIYGDQDFETFKENSVEGGSSSVDYVLVVDNNEVALCEAKSPSVMHHVGKILPEYGIKLTWLPSKSLLRKILSKVSTPSPSIMTLVFRKVCIGRFVSRPQTHGMAVSNMPQLLDCLPACQ